MTQEEAAKVARAAMEAGGAVYELAAALTREFPEIDWPTLLVPHDPAFAEPLRRGLATRREENP